MSKRETPMTRWYWEQVGGTLIEEFPVVDRGSACSARWIDGVIIADGARGIAKATEVSLRDRPVIAVQAKDNRLGMSLMGQALFSSRLLARFAPSSVVSVALCRAGDSVMESLLAEFPEIRVVVCPKEIRCQNHGGPPGA